MALAKYLQDFWDCFSHVYVKAALPPDSKEGAEMICGIAILRKARMEGGITKFIGRDMRDRYCTGYLTTKDTVLVHVRKFGYNAVRAMEDYANR